MSVKKNHNVIFELTASGQKYYELLFRMQMSLSTRNNLTNYSE
jgi:hypothetical protein